MWSKIDPNDLKDITDYLPISSILSLRLVCQRWCEIVTPYSFKYVSFKMLTRSQSNDYISKYGQYFTHLIPTSRYDYTRLNLSTLSQYLPNLIYFELSQPDVVNFNGYNEIIHHWPNLKSLKTYFINRYFHSSLQECQGLKSLYLYNSDFRSLTSSPLNAKIMTSLRELHCSTYRFNFYQFAACIDNYRNLTLLNLSYLSSLAMTLEDCRGLFMLISRISQLRQLTVKLKLNSSSINFEDDTPSQTLFPPEFQVNQLDRLTLFFDYQSDQNQIPNPNLETLNPFNISCNSYLNIFKNNCNSLKYLKLCDINGDLIDMLLEHCPNLETLILQNALPKPTVKDFSFKKLKNLQTAGFLEETIDDLDYFRSRFPKVTQFGMLRSFQLTSSEQLTQWNLIPVLFPNVQQLTLHSLTDHIYNNVHPVTKLNWTVLETSLSPNAIITFLQSILPIAPDLSRIKFELGQIQSDSDKAAIEEIKSLEARLKLFSFSSNTMNELNEYII